MFCDAVNDDDDCIIVSDDNNVHQMMQLCEFLVSETVKPQPSLSPSPSDRKFVLYNNIGIILVD